MQAYHVRVGVDAIENFLFGVDVFDLFLANDMSLIKHLYRVLFARFLVHGGDYAAITTFPKVSPELEIREFLLWRLFGGVSD